MCNCYGMDQRLEGMTHIFPNTKDRDLWVDANRDRRNQLDCDGARKRARADGLCVCHGDAKPPKSWGIWLRDTPYAGGSLYWQWD